MDLVESAICFAAQKHNGQRRKLLDIPYILHPVEVAAIAGTITSDPNVIAAAVLHDTVEDTGTTFEELQEHFGRRVALLVMTETEEKRPERPANETWELRKEESINMLENSKDIGVKIMWLSDKLSNMRSFSREYRKRGDAIWQSLNQKDPARQAWYYRTIAKALLDLKNTDAFREYVELINFVFQNIPGKFEY